MLKAAISRRRSRVLVKALHMRKQNTYCRNNTFLPIGGCPELFEKNSNRLIFHHHSSGFSELFSDFACLSILLAVLVFLQGAASPSQLRQVVTQNNLQALGHWPKRFSSLVLSSLV